MREIKFRAYDKDNEKMIYQDGMIMQRMSISGLHTITVEFLAFV
jgi:hypothetical protein